MPQRKKTVKIPGYAEEVLRDHLEVEGCFVRITTELQRADYVGVDKILKALGGKWSRKEKAHVFPSEPRAIIDEAIGAGEALDKKKTLEQFDTPPELAKRMVELAELSPYSAVLEPSAGIGNLLDPILKVLGTMASVRAIELDLDRANLLDKHYRRRGVDVWQGDFLGWPGEDDYLVDPFDAVIMNPPFSNNQDIDHVLHAWECLAPGGRLVAIISPHSSFATEERCLRFRNWLVDIGAEIHELEEGTFSASGTEVRSQLIVAIKGEMEILRPHQPVKKQKKADEPLPLFERFGLT